jgi:hypothetical protein
LSIRQLQSLLTPIASSYSVQEEVYEMICELITR